jgi:hypothetical protein
MRLIEYKPHSWRFSSLFLTTWGFSGFSLPVLGIITLLAFGGGSAGIFVFSHPTRRKETAVVFEIEAVDLGLCGALMILIVLRLG